MMKVLCRPKRSFFSVVVFLFLLMQNPSQATAVSGRGRRPSSQKVVAPPRGRDGAKSAWTEGLRSGLASALAAACVKTTLQPVDAIKTLQQYHQATTASTGSASLTVWQAWKQITSRPGGIANLYAGLGVTVIGAMPGVALYFGVYSYCKRKFLATDTGAKHKTATIALSAAIGNTVASFSRVPYEVLKQKLQAGVYTSTWEAFRVTARSGEWGAFLFPKGGVAIQMVRDVPYAVVTLLAYESLQAALQRSRRSSTAAAATTSVSTKKAWDFVLGGTAGGLGSYVTNPADVMKTRLQTDSARYQGSLRACAVELWQEGGPAAFLRGSVPRLAHKIPANAFFFLFYEFFKRVLGVPTVALEDTEQPKAVPRAARVQKR